MTKSPRVTSSWTLAAATPADLPEILAIYNEVIRNSTAVYSETEFTPERGAAWLATKQELGFPFIVARAHAGAVVGFGTLGEFRAWPCYRHSVEHTLHVRADHRGRGIGRVVLHALIEASRALDKHVLIAGIDADNAVSIGLHESLGFTVVGHLHEVGFKFGRWLDLKFLELRL